MFKPEVKGSFGLPDHSMHEVRDRMQDWAELLDASIRGQQCSANTIHLEVMYTS